MGFDISFRGEGKTNGTIDFCNLIGRVKLQNPMTGNPSAALLAKLWYNYDVVNNCRFYIVENSSTLKKYELWIYQNESYKSFLLQVNDYAGDVKWHMTSGTLPETDYLSCSADGVIGRSLISEKSSNWSITSSQPTGPLFWFNIGNRV